MSTGRDTVICTPELLELILWHLPMRHLLVAAPLVSQTWRAITLTPALQCALFFRPDPFSESRDNPLLAELFPPFFSVGGYSGADASGIMSMPWSRAPDAFKRADASWRRMLVTQPPTQTMAITETIVTPNYAGPPDESTPRRAVLNDLSLRMGFLYDIAAPFTNHVASAFCIRWHTGEAECDLTLAVGAVADPGVISYSTDGRDLWLHEGLDQRFYSEGWKEVDINFEEVVLRPDGSLGLPARVLPK